ncbi:N-acetylglucosamine-6-phosphate deacetylase [Mesoplasma sp. JKS002658]|uniref:N-acetylglucosamine-6-phosphate deacetylase n=1 Tax=Mesoplasma whartonense TaxID=2878854 RepID=UPI002022A2BC|nr:MULTISPECIES: N-acetylglucosamine-6-phosphate deacetylase [unclassified Mesoplasma]MCL8211203.1 N-acetylglucosamine-6-phosphate deacetylase [Mesoplasma sp. JKS002664]MCL8211864.1 N-acetylglucosamine-6-phosphate deacetylase [Mesoplasma sp. JKS002662]MCL8214031.1 N-acetylglucosamine-6-phosphate deacetylase [Mesoplasma sp. JKS002658]MCL8214541.1 N-acetylglucosamine-6-phosphate deacetylase [Mesoplasma sp. JKS002663]MCL8215350.1 N-acetylglucosamine-6-phosphate deacetylase [Mesoplasma sp. JKS0026
MIIKNAQIVLVDQVVKGWMEILDDKIVKICPGETDQLGVDLNWSWIMPGFIDCHVHGGYGITFESGRIEDYVEYAKKTPQEGVTSFCLTSVTNTVEKNNQYYAEFGKFMLEFNHGEQATCLGAHLEGPFIAPSKKGAHDATLLKKPDIKLTQQWNQLTHENLKIVTYAPEEQDGSYTKWLIQNKILPSAGHCNIGAKQFLEQEYLLGVRHVTHLFNQMSGVDHHHPGLVVAAMDRDDILCEVISDGIHLDPLVLEMIYKTKGSKGIVIVTDGMIAKGMKDGDYLLGDLSVTKKGLRVVLKGTDTLAASPAGFDHNVRTYAQLCQIPMVELAHMSATNIAKQLNIIDHTGMIAPGMDADLVVLSNDLVVEQTIIKGKVVYQNEHKDL